jgi:hypothetical protein
MFESELNYVRRRLVGCVLADSLRFSAEQVKALRTSSSESAEEGVLELVEWKERARAAEARAAVLEARCVLRRPLID